MTWPALLLFGGRGCEGRTTPLIGELRVTVLGTNMKLSTDDKVTVWLSPAAVAVRLGISRAQVSRLAVKYQWKRLDISTSPGARNAGVRYHRSSVEEFEKTHSY